MPTYGKSKDKRQKRSQKYQEDSLPEQLTSREVRRSFGPIQGRTEAQGQLISQIMSKDITFSVGPAGTGKTYVATALAAEQLTERKIDKIILTRPMAACDEEFGFLPGDENEKFAPWVAPMMDVLEERMGPGYVKWAMKSGVIVCSPLMTMRGSSFKDSWIILDEAQNTTPNQMKMFLTRIGENCKMIINGDLGQSDLRDGRGNVVDNGLADATTRLSGMPSIGMVRFSVDDCVRHGIVKDILSRY